MEDKKKTTVGGKETGDYTESGNPTHKEDGTFGSKGDTGSTSSSDITSEKLGKMGFSEEPKKAISSGLKSKISLFMKEKKAGLSYGVKEKFEQLKNTIVSLRNFMPTRERNEKNRDFKRHWPQENLEAADQAMKTIFKNSNLSMRVKFSVISSIIKDNKFKNLHEVGTGGGCTDSSFRGEMSHDIFGSPATSEREQRYDFEKYGFLANKDIVSSISYSDRAKQYGDCCFTFKNENCKGRTTYTIGDSLGTDYLAPNLVGDTFNPNCCVSSYTSKDMNVDIEELKKCKKVSEFTEKFHVGYVEIQYHGDFTLDDVKDLRIPGKYYRDSPGSVTNIVKSLNERNIPVYTNIGGEDKQLQYNPLTKQIEEWSVEYDKL